MSNNGYSREVVERAIETLNGVIQIARNEQLQRGWYLSRSVTNPKLAERGAVCGGHRACFIGSLWLAAGIKPQVSQGSHFLLHVEEHKRRHAWRRRPHLKLALDAANTAAERYAARRGLHLSPLGFRSPAEELFEHGLRNRSRGEVRDHVIRVCNNAKRAIRREHAEVLA